MESYQYDYTKAREYCEQLGMVFLEDWVPAIDIEFSAARLTQEQADLMMRAYMWRVKHLFTPSIYTWKQRIGLAFRFLFK